MVVEREQKINFLRHYANARDRTITSILQIGIAGLTQIAVKKKTYPWGLCGECELGGAGSRHDVYIAMLIKSTKFVVITTSIDSFLENLLHLTKNCKHRPSALRSAQVG